METQIIYRAVRISNGDFFVFDSEFMLPSEAEEYIITELPEGEYTVIKTIVKK